MKVRFFNPGKGYKKIKKEIDREMQRVLLAGDLILREDVEKFEQDVADYVGAKYCVSLNSCTDALYLALRALGIGKGDKVLVSSLTFVASVQTIIQVGATPVMYDLGGIKKIPKNTKAIIPVHIEGAIDRNMDEVMRLARKHKLYVIEDSAQAFGATYKGKKAGTIGDAGCYSFYPAKTLGAYGDAGALVTNNQKIYEYVRDCRNHFKDDSRDWGVNSRLDNLQAAILNVKFKYYDYALDRRDDIARQYSYNLLATYPIGLPIHSDGRIWQDYIIRTGLRDELYNFLKENGIETLKNNYPFPIPKPKLAQAYEDETLRLPCNETITDKEVEFVIGKIREFFDLASR